MLEIDGKKVSSKPAYNYSDMYYIKDVCKDADGGDTGISITPGTLYTAEILVKDQYDREWVSTTSEITFAADDRTPEAETKYISSTEESFTVHILNCTLSYTDETIAGVSLLDSAGGKMAESYHMYVRNMTDNRYQDVFGSYSCCYLSSIYSSFFITFLGFTLFSML